MRSLQDSSSKSLKNDRINQLLSDQEKIASWLVMEATLAKAQAKFGLIPKEAAEIIEEKARIENLDLAKIEAIKAEIGHGFVPFVKVFTEVCGEDAGKYVHYGVTTQNIQQSGQLYIARQINHEFKLMLADILDNYSSLAKKHAHDVMAGRTHGRHAVPITFGYKVSVWIYELSQAIEGLLECEKRAFQIMMGGAVGGFNTFPDHGRDIQKEVSRLLGMPEMSIPSRNINSHKEEYMMHLALVCNCLHKMAQEVYYTGLEEIGEISESFKGGTVGSSTMPHKINPKLAKGIIANADKLYSTLIPGLYSNIRLFEGDSSSYLLFDRLMEEAQELTNEVLIRARELTRTMHVHTDKLKTNAWLNKGLDNAEHIMMELAKVIGKDQAHQLLYSISMNTELNYQSFYDLLRQEPMLASFSDQDLRNLIDPEQYTGLCAQLAVEQADHATGIASALRL